MPAKSTPMFPLLFLNHLQHQRRKLVWTQDSNDDELNKMSCGFFLVNPLYNPVVLRQQVEKQGLEEASP